MLLLPNLLFRDNDVFGAISMLGRTVGLGRSFFLSLAAKDVRCIVVFLGVEATALLTCVLRLQITELTIGSAFVSGLMIGNDDIDFSDGSQCWQ